MRDFLHRRFPRFIYSTAEQQEIERYQALISAENVEENRLELESLLEKPHVQAFHEKESSHYNPKTVEFHRKEVAKWSGKLPEAKEFKIEDRSDKLSADAPLAAKVAWGLAKSLQVKQSVEAVTSKLPLGFAKPEMVSEVKDSAATSQKQDVSVPTRSTPSELTPLATAHQEFPKQNIKEDQKSYGASVSQTVGDALTWLSERSGGIPYSMLMFSAARVAGTSSSVATAAAIAALSSAPKVGAVAIGNSDGLRTTVYCGPTISCLKLRQAAQKGELALVEFDRKQRINSIQENVDRVLMYAHGNKEGKMGVGINDLQQPDDFAEKFFPNSAIIHALACKIGTNPQKEFAVNSLQPNQVLFLHAGAEEVSGWLHLKTIKALISRPDSAMSRIEFPAHPIKIIAKESRSKTIFAEISPTSLSEIASLINDNQGKDRTQIINLIYEKIANNANAQKAKVLEGLTEVPDTKNTINSELEKLGFLDRAKEIDPAIREKCVEDYLTKSAMLLLDEKRDQASMLQELNVFFEAGLINPNSPLRDGPTITYFAAGKGLLDVVKYFIEQGANVDLAIEGESILYEAAGKGHLNFVKFLVENYPQFINHLTFPTINPFIQAVENGYFEIVKFLAEKYPDAINQVLRDGTLSLLTPAKKGYFEIVKFLTEKHPNLIHKVDVDSFTPFLTAAAEGHLDIVKFLVETDPNVINQAHKDGATALDFALQRRHFKIAELLIKKNPTLAHKREKDGYTHFFRAATEGDFDVINLFVEAYPDVINQVLSDYQIALCLAAQKGHLEIVKFLTEKYPSLINKADGNGFTPFLTAAVEGHFETVKFLVETYPDVINQVLPDNTTALYLATDIGNFEIVKFLIDQDRSLINKADNAGDTPLLEAIRNGKFEIAVFLVENGANPELTAANKNAYESAQGNQKLIQKIKEAREKFVFFEAIESDSLEKVKFLINKNPHLVHKVENDGFTPFLRAIADGRADIVNLFVETDRTVINQTLPPYQKNALNLAMENGHFDIAKLLIERDPKLIHAVDQNGSTAILTAIYADNFEAVQFLAENGASLEKTEISHMAPLHCAIRNAVKPDIVEFLITQNVNVNYVDPAGINAVFLAADKNKPDILSLLIRAEADVNKARAGETPLFIAAYRGNYDCVKVLADNNANLDVPDQHGTTPLHVSVIMGNLSTTKLLVERGSKINVQKKDSATPLIDAITQYNKLGSNKKQYSDVIIFLVENGADLQLKTSFGNAYERIGKNPDLVKEVTEARKRYEEKSRPNTTTAPVAEEKLAVDSIDEVKIEI